MKNITVGYFKLSDKSFLSSIVIDEDFLNLLSRCTKVKIISVRYRQDLEGHFKNIKRYNIDYLYIDSFDALLQPFLLRERFYLDMPFIIMLHAVFPWALKYAQILPLLRAYDIILAPSQYARESFYRISDKFDVHVMPYSLDVERIRRITQGHLNRPGRTIAFMGRLTEEKGIGTLIDCMPQLVKKLGNIRLNIIGPLGGSKVSDSPKDKYVKGIEAKIRKSGLANRISLLGMKLGLEKYKALAGSDVFVNPTVASEETFSIVNIDALACGVPVIATDWAANRELIMNGKNGYLMGLTYDSQGKPYIDAEELTFLIMKVFKDPKLNLKLKKGAAASASNYDYRKVLPGLINLLGKKKKKGQDEWHLLKDKTVTNFRHIFNRDFLFFICAVNNHLRTETYADLYDRFIARRNFKSKIEPSIAKAYSKDDGRYEEIINNLNRDYKNFLCLQEKAV